MGAPYENKSQLAHFESDNSQGSNNQFDYLPIPSGTHHQSSRTGTIPSNNFMLGFQGCDCIIWHQWETPKIRNGVTMEKISLRSNPGPHQQHMGLIGRNREEE